MQYNYTQYENFKELKGCEPELAKAMLEQIDDGDWMEEELIVYPTVEDFATYELTDGWYINSDFKDDYNGAPNPFDYIDMEAFGKALISNWDESCNLEVDGMVITTSCGW